MSFKLRAKRLKRYSKTKFKILLLALIGLYFSGCAADYQAFSNFTLEGYTDHAVNHNSFYVRYKWGFASPQRVKDFALLRASDLSLKNGFKYFSIFKSSHSKNEYPNHFDAVIYECIVACYRQKPTHVKTYFNAKEFYELTAAKYDLFSNGRLKLQSVGMFRECPTAIKFTLKEKKDLHAISSSQVQVIVGTENLRLKAYFLGYFTHLENPMNTVDNFINVARDKSAEYGANLLFVENDPNVIINDTDNYNYVTKKNKLIGFVAELYFAPKAILGVEWAPADYVLNKYIVRDFYQRSNAPKAGLKFQDQILEINGIDVLEENKILQEYNEWKPGDLVILTVIRNGEKISISVPLIANQIPDIEDLMPLDVKEKLI